eukprot:scaffold12.g8189.t1
MALQRAALVGVLALLATCAAETAAPSPIALDDSAEFYFANLVTGATQWADPGDAPYIDDDGNRYWRDGSGQWTRIDPNAWKYKWVERWSEEQARPYYFNQHTKASIWTRPADLAWARVKVTDANHHNVPPRPYQPGKGAAPSPVGGAAATPNITGGTASA